ncbi:GNAT family N-acetyltransferase [Zhengella sp. ZM62]|uniref:GNAT family N-acetyltransferase n=1 Tax=Zhengella sedimenti TaxID=3390035 RepID=UPI003976C023
MSEQHTIDIQILRLKDAHAFAPLLAAYSQALKRGAPRRPDEFYAEQILQDRTAEVLGARIDGELVGFLIFYDVPEPVSGLRMGVCDHIYVHHDHRNKGIAKALVDVLADQAEERGWSKLHLHAPRQPEDGRKLYERIAAPADWSSFIIRFDDK